MASKLSFIALARERRRLPPGGRLWCAAHFLCETLTTDLQTKALAIEQEMARAFINFEATFLVKPALSRHQHGPNHKSPAPSPDCFPASRSPYWCTQRRKASRCAETFGCHIRPAVPAAHGSRSLHPQAADSTGSIKTPHTADFQNKSCFHRHSLTSGSIPQASIRFLSKLPRRRGIKNGCRQAQLTGQHGMFSCMISNLLLHFTGFLAWKCRIVYSAAMAKALCWKVCIEKIINKKVIVSGRIL